MSIIKSSDLSNWYTRLNSIRNKSGINLGNETVETVSSNETININKIKNLQEKINKLKSNTFLAYADYKLEDLSSINENTIIKSGIKDKIDSTLDSLDRICAKNSTTSDITNTCITASNITNQCKTTSNNTNNCKTYNDSTNSTCKTTDYYTAGGDSTCRTSSCDTTGSSYSAKSNRNPGGEYHNQSNCSTSYNLTSSCSTNYTSSCGTSYNITNSTCKTQGTCKTNSTCKTYGDDATNSTCKTYGNFATNSTCKTSTNNTYSVKN